MLAYMLIYAYDFASRVTYTMHIVSPYMFTTLRTMLTMHQAMAGGTGCFSATER